MRVSYNLLQDYFEDTLPSPKDIGEILTNHAFEIESIEEAGNDVCLDVKILPDRSHDCLSHRGIALELALQANLKLKKEKAILSEVVVPESNCLKVENESTDFCKRFGSLVIEGVEVKESPVWLKDRLKTLGQRSINNIVDATNYIMFSLGQPLHAYDRNLLESDGNTWKIVVRNATQGETLVALDGKEYVLSSDMVVISDGSSGKALGIAGVKGGKASEITNNTTDIILEAANFKATSVRKTAKTLGLRTDASVRFENEITPELTGAALKEALDLILTIAAGDHTQVEGMVDLYPRKAAFYKVGVSVSEIHAVLGMELGEKTITEILERRGYVFEYISPRDRVTSLAPTYVGVPYVRGASVVFDAPRSFDCSSFTSFLYKEVGIAIPRMSVDQYVFGQEIQREDLLPGDLVFSNSGTGTIHFESIEWKKGMKVPEGIDHVGLYMGENTVIHATGKAGAVVSETLSDSPSFQNIVGYRRMMNEEKRFVVTIPPERIDIRIREDLVKEIGRTFGYETLEAKKIEPFTNSVSVEKTDYYSNIIRNTLIDIGFSEVITYAFQNSGEVELQNPLASDKAYLRSSLIPGLSASKDLNMRNIDLLGLKQIAIFEIGNVFTEGSEFLSLGIAIGSPKGFKPQEGDITVEAAQKALSEAFGTEILLTEKDGIYTINLTDILNTLPESTTPLVYTTFPHVEYKKHSEYPAVFRDIAVFLPEGSSSESIIDVVKHEAGELLVQYRLFDTFTKDFNGEKKTSYAFRLAFQSMDKTLTDTEITAIMEKVAHTLSAMPGVIVR